MTDTPKKTVKTVPAIRFKGPGEKINLIVPVPNLTIEKPRGSTMVELTFTAKPMPLSGLSKRNVDAALTSEAAANENRLELVEIDESGNVVTPIPEPKDPKVEVKL